MKSLVSLTGADGARHLLSPKAIARITEAGASSQWHGIRAFVKLFDGHTLEVQQTADEIGRAVAQALEAASQGAIHDC